MLRIKLALLAVATAMALPAQTYNGHGYAYFGIDKPAHASMSEAMTVGGGGEAFAYKGLAAGVELGYMFPRGYFREGIGLVSVWPSYHFVNRKRPAKLVPFVTAGYTLAFRQGTENLWHWGGGVTYWFHNRIGTRVEVRDYRHDQYWFDTALRFGLTFR